MRPTQFMGLVLWRAGLFVVTAYSLYRGAKLALLYVEWPLQVEVGVGLIAAGAAMVMGSLIIERMRDARLEQEAAE